MMSVSWSTVDVHAYAWNVMPFGHAPLNSGEPPASPVFTLFQALGSAGLHRSEDT
jgi:hypothetical protein